jgi:hypothetical protein
MKEALGMRIETDDCRRDAFRLGCGDGRFDDMLVADMNAIEAADRCAGANRQGRIGMQSVVCIHAERNNLDGAV